MHRFISARAGSGKTTKCMSELKALPSNTSNCYLSFNTANAEEAKARLEAEGIRNCWSGTLNKCGFSMTKLLFPRAFVKANKDDDILFFEICKKDWKMRKLVQPAVKLVAMLKCIGHNPEDALPSQFLADIEELYGLDGSTHSNYYNIVRELYQLSCQTTTVVDFNDQILFPTIHGYTPRPSLQYDNIYVDEAQDLNGAQINMLKLMAGPRTNLVAVGDPFQAIYGFRGSSVQAVDNLIAEFNMTTETLPTCWRCSKAVIREAQTIVPDIVFKPDAVEGSVHHILPGDDKIPYLNTLDPSKETFVICRTRAPLIALAVERMQANKPFTIRMGAGGDKQIIEIHDKMMKESMGEKPEYVRALESWLKREIIKLKALKKISAMRFLEDTCDILKEIAKRVDLPLVEQTINSIFAKSEGKGSSSWMVLSTIHQAKGLEADDVYLIHPELLPHPKAEGEWRLRQEKNLQYIAVTRARVNFTYVYSDEQEKDDIE